MLRPYGCLQRSLYKNHQNSAYFYRREQLTIIDLRIAIVPGVLKLPLMTAPALKPIRMVSILVLFLVIIFKFQFSARHQIYRDT
jgi:hypothetical protein